MMNILFFIMSVLLIASAMAVISFRNPIHSALALVLNMTVVAGLYASLGAHFLAVVQIAVYAGAIMVLVIFVLMLLNLKDENPKKLNLSFLGLALLCGVGFIAFVTPSIQEAFSVFPQAPHAIEGTLQNIGRILYTTYVFTFEAAALLLTAALVGAVMLAKRGAKKGARI